MSTAFERAMDEIRRVWDSSDRFDTKVLQFTALTSAGTFAAGAILADKVSGPYPWHVLALGIGGVAAMLLFGALAIRSAIGEAFSGPLDPRELAKNPAYVDDDERFEKDLLPFIALAFDQCLNAQERKWRLFKRSLWALGVSAILLAGALTSYVLAPKPVSLGGAPVMADNKPSPTPASPPKTPQPTTPAPAPDSAPKPVLGPYTITRGAEIPNNPKSGPFPRDTTEKK